ncbi:MAG TPA: RsmD family RNA methyltransferase, partial [Candidatus Ozemobacteraceae bacterium]|nr:RsmD family RNA methyltransferase [Candidatus Ozemobacteraceae bacterium]
GNLFQNKLLVREVVRLSGASEGKRIIEGFAGAGNLTIPLADAGATVEAVESHPGAIRMAIRNRQRSKCAERITIIESDALKELGKLAPNPDVLVIDPPRTGMPTLAAALSKLNPGCVVYVACDMEALRRDALSLAKAGYKPIEVVGIDLYPRTHHVEAIVKFER